MSHETENPQPGQMIEVDWTDEPLPVYANGAQLVHTTNEFSLCFTDYAAFAGRHAKEGSAAPRARVVSSVRLHPDTYFQFVVACASNWNKFINRLSPEGSKPPKFKLLNMGALQLEGLEPPGEQDDEE